MNKARTMALLMLTSIVVIFFSMCKKNANTPPNIIITYNSNGGSAVTNQTVQYGNKFIKPNEPTREGYVFAGWYVDDIVFSNAFNFEDSYNNEHQTSFTLYAKWKKIFTLRFETNGGVFVDTQFLVEDVKPIRPAITVRNNYPLQDWYSDQSLTTPFNFDQNLTANTTVYAKYYTDRYIIPDVNFRTALKVVVANAFIQDTMLLDNALLTSVEVLDLSNKQISSLTGIHFFTKITKLYCNGNNLLSIDLSKNTLLTILLLNGNKLTNIDLSKNPALDILLLNDNYLINIDLSKNTDLTFLRVQNNELSSIDISNNTALTNFYCTGNKIKDLNVSTNINLQSLVMYNMPSLNTVNITGIRTPADFSVTSTSNYGIIFGVDADVKYPFAPITILKVHDNIKDYSEIKTIKNIRNTNLIISTYKTSSPTSIDYTLDCYDYDPVSASCIIQNAP